MSGFEVNPKVGRRSQTGGRDAHSHLLRRDRLVDPDQVERDRGSKWQTATVTAASTEPTSDHSLVAPDESFLDKVREVVAAFANLEPTGIAGALIDILNVWIPTEYEKRSREFQEAVVDAIRKLEARCDDWDDRLALAAYSTGALAASRSASEEHLEYLAAATAHTMMNPDDVPRDSCIMILRLVGDLTATHIRVLLVYADPHGVAGRNGRAFTWTGDGEGQYPREQLFEADPDLTEQVEIAGQIASDLMRNGLVQGGMDFARAFERGLLDIDLGEFPENSEVDPDNPPHGVTELGRQVIAFISG
jgi:hypothetical protein